MVICIECAAPVSCIYRRFPSSSQENIRLQRCDACGATADKYVEYETLLLFVELLLHKPQTYRHILFNRLPYADTGLPRPLYRLAVAFILFEAYTFWFLLHVDRVPFSKSSDYREDHSKEGEGEQILHNLEVHQVHGKSFQSSLPHVAVEQQQQQRRKCIQRRRSHTGPQSQGSKPLPHLFQRSNNADTYSEQAPSANHQQREGIRQSAVLCPPSSGASAAGADAADENPHAAADSSTCSSSRRCRSCPVSLSGPPPPSAADAFPISTSSADSAHVVTHTTGGPNGATAAGAASDDLLATSACKLKRGIAGAERPPLRFPEKPNHAAAACGSRCDAILQQNEEALPKSAAASLPRNARLAESRDHMSTSLPSTAPRSRPSTVAATEPLRHAVSATGVSDSELHADMLRWLLHNPVVSVDQQFLIFSVSILDFLVYLFAIIFFTDLYLRFSFKRQHAQQQGQQHQHCTVTSMFCVSRTATAANFDVTSPLCCCRRLGTTADEADGRWHHQSLERMQLFSARGAVQESCEAVKETISKGVLEVNECGRLAVSANPVQTGAETEQAESQRGPDVPTGKKAREGSVCKQDAGSGPEDSEEETEPAQETDSFKASESSLFLKAAREHGRWRTVGFVKRAWATTFGCGFKLFSTYVDATECLSFLSSVWCFSLAAASTAAREILLLLFRREQHREEAAKAAESRGVILIKYNYLAAAVTLSMFGKLGQLILMAWEESLSPRVFTSLFTMTSNVLAVDVFLNSRHPTPAAVIVLAAASVRATARRAQQLAFPSVAFPASILFGAAQIGTYEHFSPLLNFLALLL